MSNAKWVLRCQRFCHVSDIIMPWWWRLPGERGSGVVRRAWISHRTLLEVVVCGMWSWSSGCPFTVCMLSKTDPKVWPPWCSKQQESLKRKRPVTVRRLLLGPVSSALPKDICFSSFVLFGHFISALPSSTMKGVFVYLISAIANGFILPVSFLNVFCQKVLCHLYVNILLLSLCKYSVVLFLKCQCQVKVYTVTTRKWQGVIWNVSSDRQWK